MADEKSKTLRITGTVAAGVTLAPVVVWAWNGFIPEGWPEMTATVAAPLGYALGELVRYVVSWFPSPHRE